MLLLIALSVLLAWWWARGNPAQGDGEPAPSAASQATPAQATDVVSSSPSGPDAWRSSLARGALKGIKVTGDWCTKPESGLTPCAALRDRFEYYLIAASVVPPGALRELVEDDAKRAHGVAVAEQIVVVYDRYLMVRDYHYQKPLDLNDPAVWHAALQERHQVRWQGLGAEWAQVFFGPEELAAQADLDKATSGKSEQTLKPQPTPPRAGLGKGELESVRLNPYVDLVRQEWIRLDSDRSLGNQERMALLKRFVAQNVDPKDQDRVMMIARMPKP